MACALKAGLSGLSHRGHELACCYSLDLPVDLGTQEGLFWMAAQKERLLSLFPLSLMLRQLRNADPTSLVSALEPVPSEPTGPAPTELALFGKQSKMGHQSGQDVN